MQPWNSNVCHIDRFHSSVHDSRVYVERVRIERTTQPDMLRQVHFGSCIAFIDNGSSHFNRRDQQQNNDNDKRSNDDVSVLNGGSGGVGNGGNHGLGVDGECMSDRRFKSRFKSIAYSDTFSKSSDNDDNMTTTDNDDKTTKARRATHAGHDLDRQKTSSGGSPNKEAGMIPSDMSVPALGLVCLEGHVSANTGCIASSLLCGNCTLPQLRRGVVPGCKPVRFLKTRANPSGSSTTHSTQGTGTQGKTRGRHPGPDVESSRSLGGRHPPAHHRSQGRNACRFSRESERRNACRFSDCNC